jgi:hypothetical protein
MSAGDIVVYEVYSDGPIEEVHWQNSEGVDVVDIPLERGWSRQIVNQTSYKPRGPNYMLMASTYGQRVSCKLTVNGVVIQADTALAPFAVVCCLPSTNGGCLKVD